jgi:hypothetical protein
MSTEQFLRRIDAGVQSSDSDYSHSEGVTVYRTEDTSAPYPSYMHQPVTDAGDAATLESYYQLTDADDGMSAEQLADASDLAARMLATIE